jgi:hypothetical protein
MPYVYQQNFSDLAAIVSEIIGFNENNHFITPFISKVTRRPHLKFSPWTQGTILSTSAKFEKQSWMENAREMLLKYQL